MRRIKSKTLKRFALSFLGVFALPVIFFVYLFINDFKEIYRDKVTEQAENALMGTANELDRQIETLYDIVAYNSRLIHFQSYSVKNDIMGKEIITTLNAEEAVHPALVSVYYYNEVKPDRLYTSIGTYTLDYYAKLVLKLEGKEQLLAVWDSLDGDGWLCLKGKNDSDREENVLQYVIRTKNREMWIFTFSEKELEKILGGNNAVTTLLDSAGNQLYVFEKRQDVEDVGYEISAESQSGYFKVVRLNNEEDLF